MSSSGVACRCIFIRGWDKAREHHAFRPLMILSVLHASRLTSFPLPSRIRGSSRTPRPHFRRGGLQLDCCPSAPLPASVQYPSPEENASKSARSPSQVDTLRTSSRIEAYCRLDHGHTATNRMLRSTGTHSRHSPFYVQEDTIEMNNRCSKMLRQIEEKQPGVTHGAYSCGVTACGLQLGLLCDPYAQVLLQQ
jgi:hypothetical protein